MKEDKLGSQIWNDVKPYFPDFDPTGLWRVELKNQLWDGYLGNSYANRRTKILEIYELFTTSDDNVWRRLLIHETCHAITGSTHGPKWTAMMLEVASRADLSGQQSLADSIRADVQESQNCAEPNLNPILYNIQAIASEHPDELDEKIIDEAARAMGISGGELLERQPLVKVYCNDLKRLAFQKSD